MPVRSRAVHAMLHRAIGTQVFDGRTGTCVSMPDEDYQAARDAEDWEYEAIVKGIDWNRVLLEATGRHLTLGHAGRLSDEGFDTCGDCVQAALLTDDTWPRWAET